MYNKTTSAYFLKFGKVTDSFKTNKYLVNKKYTITDKTITTFISHDASTYIEVNDGMAIIAISNNGSQVDIQKFVIHRSIRVNKGCFFAILPLANSTTFTMYTYPNSHRKIMKLDRPFLHDVIRPKVVINEIYAYYYMVKSPGYKFKGESHQYFEITFVDNGTLDTTVEGTTYQLNNYDLLIYGPNQYHTQTIESNEPCSYLTIIFALSCEDSGALLNRVFHCPRDYYSVLDKFVKETTSPLPYSKDLMLSYLQELIIHLLQADFDKNLTKPATPIHQHFENELLEEILAFINERIFDPLPVDDICEHFSMSRSSLQNLFKDNLKVAPKQYINEAKLAKSKVLIRKSEHTISEISTMLGFNSIHYFSRKFKLRYNITPSEYAKKIYNE